VLQRPTLQPRRPTRGCFGFAARPSRTSIAGARQLSGNFQQARSVYPAQVGGAFGRGGSAAKGCLAWLQLSERGLAPTASRWPVLVRIRPEGEPYSHTPLERRRSSERRGAPNGHACRHQPTHGDLTHPDQRPLSAAGLDQDDWILKAAAAVESFSAKPSIGRRSGYARPGRRGSRIASSGNPAAVCLLTLATGCDW